MYYQIAEWKGDITHLEPTEWGWKLVNGKLQPITTHLPPGPDELLQFVKCGCKTGCSTQRCSCVKHGLDCTSTCSECKGLSCDNSQPVDASESDISNEVDDSTVP